MNPKAVFLNEVIKAGGKLVRGTKDAAVAAKSAKPRDVIRVAASGPVVRELATICGKAGIAGGVVDGSMGAVAAYKAHKEGKIDRAGAVKHVVSETGCGFVTSSTGTAGTLAVMLTTGAAGPVAMIAGMGASMGSRYVYRRIVGETLPTQQAKTVDLNEFEDIGPDDK